MSILDPLRRNQWIFGTGPGTYPVGNPINPLPPEAVEVSEPIVTKRDVFNGAAIALGFTEGVQDPDENTQIAKTLSNAWTMARRSFYEEHDWNGCKTTLTLNRLSIVPEDRWAFAYAVPGTVISIVAVNGIKQSQGETKWEEEFDLATGQRMIVTDADTVKASVIVDIIDVTHVSPKIVDTMALFLADRVSHAFPGSQFNRAKLERDLAHAMSMAKGRDGQQGTPPERTSSRLVRDRRRGGRRHRDARGRC